MLPNDAQLQAAAVPDKPEPVKEDPKGQAKVVDVRKIDTLLQEALLGREIPTEETVPEPDSSSADETWATVQRLVSQLEREKLSPQMMKMAEKNRSQVRSHCMLSASLTISLFRSVCSVQAGVAGHCPR